MKITDIRLYKFKIPFKSPLKLKNSVMNQRKGFIIKLIDDNNRFGLGEISPLPGFSNESVGDSMAQIPSLAEKLQSIDIFNSFDYPYSELEEITVNTYPSVQFGTESALLELFGKRAGMPFSKFLNNTCQNSILINGLLTGEKSQVLERASQLRHDGFKAVKLKVGRQNIDDEIELSKEVRKLIGEDIALRLDSNRAWNLSDAQQFCDGVAQLNISYLEEPLSDPKQLVNSLNNGDFSIPIALDETLNEIFPAELHTFDAVEAIVIKPTSLGLIKSLKFAHQAKAQGITPVISSSFESGLGLNHLTHIAAAIDTDDTPMGLDTYNQFADDVIKGSLPVQSGKINLDNLQDTAAALISGMLEEVGVS